jgi:hypothetical protein
MRKISNHKWILVIPLALTLFCYPTAPIHLYSFDKIKHAKELHIEKLKESTCEHSPNAQKYAEIFSRINTFQRWSPDQKINPFFNHSDENICLEIK